MSRLLTCAAIFLAALSVLAPAGSAATGAGSGWGSEASYLGRYHVHILPASSASTGSASRQAAIFSAVVSACQKLSASATRPTGGELTLFMREVKKGMPREDQRRRLRRARDRLVHRQAHRVRLDLRDRDRGRAGADRSQLRALLFDAAAVAARGRAPIAGVQDVRG